MIGEFVILSSGDTRTGGGILNFVTNDGCTGKMIVVPKFRKAKLEWVPFRCKLGPQSEWESGMDICYD